MTGRPDLSRLTRRRLFVASGVTLAVSAPAFLAACGSDEDDEASPEEQVELLNEVLAAHLAVLAAANEAGGSDGPLPGVVAALVTRREDSVGLLEAYVAEADGEPTDEPAEAAQGESPAEALTIQLEDSIATTLAAVGMISAAAYRQAIHRGVTEDAAALAALRSVVGGEVAPDAFVFGPSASEEQGS